MRFEISVREIMVKGAILFYFLAGAFINNEVWDLGMKNGIENFFYSLKMGSLDQYSIDITILLIGILIKISLFYEY